MTCPTEETIAYLPLRYVLTDSVAVRTSYDPLRVDSEGVVSGRAQRGMLAAALSRAGRERELTEWVARGDRVRFAPAHPRIEGGGGAVVALPAPAHLYVPGKDGDTLVDAFAGGTDAPGVPYRALREPVTVDRSRRASVDTTAERYLGRSSSGERGRGMPFFTTSLDPGQVFEARWQLRGPDPDFVRGLAERILDVLAEARGSLTLGAAGTRAHGGVEVGPVDPDRPLSPDRVDRPETPSWNGGEVDLLLISPALTVGEQGQYRPHALVPAVRELWKRRAPEADPPEVVAAHVEPVLVGAYHRAYRGPMAQRWAAAPGSVVRLRAGRAPTPELVRELESHTLGERAVDGYGQFVLLPTPPPGAAPLPEASAPRPERREGTVTLTDGRVLPAPDPRDHDRWPDDLYDTLLWNAAVGPVRDHARASARALSTSAHGTLRRLREVISDPRRSPDETLTALRATLDASAGPEDALHRRLAGLSGGEAALRWWTSSRPEDAHGSAYARGIAAVDLALTDGLPPEERPSGLSERAERWERRDAARLCLLWVASWLAEAVRAPREGTRRGEEGPR